MYSKSFKDLIEESSDKTYIGRGNPNAKILLVGQEYSKPNEKSEFEAKYWSEKIALNERVYLTHKKEVGEGHTWNKYQKLHDYIFEKAKTDEFDFEELIFTTEMSEIPQKNNRNARKNPEFLPKLLDRKRHFFKSNFIQDFPVIVLACSDYIKNNDEIREIDEIFGVHYKDEYEKKIYTKSNWFFSHYNENKTKLIIHTRQLSGNVRSELLQDMGRVIRNHLMKNNILKNTSLFNGK